MAAIQLPAKLKPRFSDLQLKRLPAQFFTDYPWMPQIRIMYSRCALRTYREGLALIYVDSTQGWVAYSRFNSPVSYTDRI